MTIVTRNQGGDSSTTNAYEYNKRRLLVGEESRVMNGATQSLGYAYDANGNAAGVRYPTGRYVHFAPDALGRPTQVAEQVAQIRYHADGSIASFVYGNGVVHSSPQNARRLPAQINDSGVQGLQYQYDGNGNVAAINDALNSNRNRTMAYDGLDRLVRAQSSSFGGNGIFAYGYDALDNLSRVSLGGVKDHTYVYDASNRLTNIRNAAGATVMGLSYDAQGNLSMRNGQGFTFDAGNRLREAVGKGRYDYDGLGRRVQAIDPDERGIRSLYGNDGVLRWQFSQREGKVMEYLYAGGRLVAQVEQPAPMGTPVLTAPARDFTGSFAVSWSDTGAASYELHVRTNAGGAWAQVYRGNARTAAIQTGSAGDYTYRVRACDGSSCAGWSVPVKVEVTFKPTDVPVLIVPGMGLSGAFTVEWSAIAGATRYVLAEAAVLAGPYSPVYDGSLLRSSVSGRAAGDLYYRVQACNAAGCGPWSGSAKVTVVHPSGTSPVLSVPTTSLNGTVAIQWSGIAGSTRYELERFRGAVWTPVYSGLALSFADAGLASGNHRYRVRTCNAAGCSSWSAEAVTTMVRVPATPPAITLGASQASGNYSVGWTTVSGASSYSLQEQAGNAAWTDIYSGAANSYAITGKGNGSWSYRVRACNAAGCSDYSAVAATQVLLPPGAAIVSVPANSASGNFSASWSGVATATSYRLEQSNGGSWAEIYVGASGSFAVTGRGTGAWSYRVRACNSSGCGVYSAVATVQVLLPPAAPTVQVPGSSANGTYRVNWSAVDMASRYELQQNASGAWSSIYDGTANGIDLTGRINGVYSYRARACNASGCGGLVAGGSHHRCAASDDCTATWLRWRRWVQNDLCLLVGGSVCI